MTAIEPWIDLLASALVDPRRGRPVVVLHEAQRVFPLVESRASVAWVHPQVPSLRDFTVQAGCRPLLRERVAAADGHTGVLLRRAGVVVVAAPQTASALQLFLNLIGQVTAGTPVLLYGELESPAWPALLATREGTAWHTLKTSAQTRVVLNHEAGARLAPQGLSTPSLEPRLALALRQVLPSSIDLQIQLDTPSGRPQMRLRPDPQQFIIAASDSMLHHIMVEGRALFNTRGLASLMLPWDGCHHARFLLRNVRDRVDDAEIAAADEALRASYLDYTERGAMMSVRLPAVPTGRDARMHLSIPRSAVPPDGFCDLGAAEFTANLE